MAILYHFAQLLEWLEQFQDFVHFLTQPQGISAVITLCLYYPMQATGASGFTSATIACAAAAVCYSLLTEPNAC